MTVEELIEKLKKLDQSAIVVLQKDAEGNGYSPLYAVDGDAIYISETTWSGKVLSTEWTADEAGFETEKEWKAYKKQKPKCCCLSPVN